MAASSPPVPTTIPDTLQQTLVSTAPSPNNPATEKDAPSPRVATAIPDTLQQTSVSIASSPQNPTFLDWFLDLTLKVLGFAAACIFGAWAPLSYKAALDANSGSDTAQSQANAAASQQSAAASQQSVALDAMNSRLGAIGQLWLFDFCITQTVRPHIF
jgi:hypothetical protein